MYKKRIDISFAREEVAKPRAELLTITQNIKHESSTDPILKLKKDDLAAEYQSLSTAYE